MLELHEKALLEYLEGKAVDMSFVEIGLLSSRSSFSTFYLKNIRNNSLIGLSKYYYDSRELALLDRAAMGIDFEKLDWSYIQD